MPGGYLVADFRCTQWAEFDRILTLVIYNFNSWKIENFNFFFKFSVCTVENKQEIYLKMLPDEKKIVHKNLPNFLKTVFCKF